MVYRGFSKSVIGSREMNQDSILVNNDRGLFAVADGVGGGVGGDVASKMAVDTINQMVQSPADLKPAVVAAQEKIYNEAMSQHGAPVMGTTLTAVQLLGDSVHICHVGDSRCYLLRDRRLELATEDHEFFDESVQATVLGSYLGIPANEHPLQIMEDVVKIQPGDRLILCSDGLYRQIDEQRIVELAYTLRDRPADLLESLCEEASLREYSDNVSVVYVEIEAEA
ncbi:MAG: serine/threonine-protein phosphatase [Bdellovibrionaceae bacterium]|nr:serine/threonine-protein phosphatase [Bdellovibrionales bacterium]MCB9253339.1 serine/threonine-protein phosphatase [Pseudobdellovibrionaceae bacterium]